MGNRLSATRQSLLTRSRNRFAAELTRLSLDSGDGIASIIPDGQTFLGWVEELQARGLRVDGEPFDLDRRPALKFIYSLVPSTLAEALNFFLAVMKGAQVGLTVWEMLAVTYMALKFEPVNIGMYVPDQTLAIYKSSKRFLPIIRSIPDAYAKLTRAAALAGEAEGRGTSRGEGNVLTRELGASIVLFLWTSGKVATESYPLDLVTFDEVQGMSVADMEKTRERLSGREKMRAVFMLSTARWPDADIDYFYQRGTQHRFHTACDCDTGVVLDEVFPECVLFNDGAIKDAPVDEYVYVCPACKAWIPDAQAGEWRATYPERAQVSVHYPQTLSATVGPGEIIEAFNNAEDLQNFYNRKLGRPWADPSQIPVTLEICQRCVAAGAAIGLEWKIEAEGAYMGIDQMGAYNVVIVKERLADGRQAVIHVEAIYDNDPFARCDELMAAYGVAVCVVETLPNYNDAKRFAARHRGRVFLAGYGALEGEMLRWGDAVQTRADRKTSAAERDRYTVTLDQYKCMQVSMTRLVQTTCLFPDPKALVQPVIERGKRVNKAICDEVFYHFTKTALVTEQDPKQHKYRRWVEKVGIDPHFSYANMLCDVAWARAHGTTQFILPQAPAGGRKTPEAIQPADTDALPAHIKRAMGEVDARPNTCGACANFRAEGSRCMARNFAVRPSDPQCPLFLPRSQG